MTYLELCVRAREEAGISGSGPSSVTEQTGQLLRLVNWVQQAWVEIQLMRPNWDFMHGEFSFDTIAETRDYLAADYSITDMKLWDENSFIAYETAVGESEQFPLINLKYKTWRDTYRVGMNVRTSDKPVYIIVLPTNEIRFEPMPDKVYTIEGDYKRSTQFLAADADELTGLPEDFHMIVVWQALKNFGFYENGPEILEEAEVNFDNLLFRLELEQLPEMSDDREALA
jgi:hypothetical protein